MGKKVIVQNMSKISKDSKTANKIKSKKGFFVSAFFVFIFFFVFICYINLISIFFQKNVTKFAILFNINCKIKFKWIENLNINESDRREIMEKIDNYITDTQLALAQTGKIKEVSTIYRTKAENKMIEAQAPIVFKNEMKVDLDEIMSQVKALKTGQAIELKPNEKGEYE